MLKPANALSILLVRRLLVCGGVLLGGDAVQPRRLGLGDRRKILLHPLLIEFERRPVDLAVLVNSHRPSVGCQLGMQLEQIGTRSDPIDTHSNHL